MTIETPGPKPLLEAVQRHKVTTLATAPTAYKAMSAMVGDYDIGSLRTCISAGEHLPAATWHAWREATGLRIVDGIGATEMMHIFISASGEDIRPGLAIIGLSSTGQAKYETRENSGIGSNGLTSARHPRKPDVHVEPAERDEEDADKHAPAQSEQRAGPAHEVPVHRLRRADGELVGVLPERLLDRSRLDPIVQLRRSTMVVHVVDIRGADPRSADGAGVLAAR